MPPVNPDDLPTEPLARIRERTRRIEEKRQLEKDQNPTNDLFEQFENAPAVAMPPPGIPFVEAAPPALYDGPKPKKTAKRGAARTPSKNMSQDDFYIPQMYDVASKDSRFTMDVALFRLSKNSDRANQIIRYDLSDGYVEVSSGAHGMASVWDYDIVLMSISHLTEAMNRYREGKGEKPGQIFKPSVKSLLQACGRSNGGRQRDELIEALTRLSTTFVKLEREKKVRNNKSVIVTEGEALIGPFKAVSNAASGKLESVEIKIADWLYKEVTEGSNPDVLTVHPDYFRIGPGLGKFIYRLARRVAGKTTAVYAYTTLHERSGSEGNIYEFTRMLKSLLKSNDLPEYTLSREEGKMGAMLRMTYRGYVIAEEAEPVE